ncbi:MAG: NAD(P)H-dependent oxidoreductase subunit E [Candidatus Rokuibacteriota bacterium]
MPGVDAIIAGFPRERTWLLPALRAVQGLQHWLSPEALEAVAAHLRVPKSEVWGVASHYPELRLTEPGEKIVRVCTGLACQTRGGREILAACERRLGVRTGATTADGSVTLEEMDCAFECGVAPVVEVGHGPYGLRGRVTVADVDTLLAPTGPHVLPGRRVVAPPARSGKPAAQLAALRRKAARRPRTRLAVGVSTCSLAVGAWETYAALKRGVHGRAEEVVVTGCNGMCWAQPAVTVVRRGRPLVVAGPIVGDGIARLLDTVAAREERELTAGDDFLAPQRRVLLERCGVVDASDIVDAIRHGAYAALAKALEDGPERVTEEVRAAGLTGRGGAYFQAAIKWAGCRAATGSPKYVVVNGEEGEPGIFKDRHLMEGDPHQLLEGMLLAAWAAGASHGIVYIHGEADLSAMRVADALEQAREWGLLGERILGSSFSFDAEIRRGAGGFVLGEETALLESLEGRRAMPRTRPPFPVESGLFGKPTVINNVETLSAVPAIVERGGAWWKSLGGGHGTKLFGLSGHVARPGIVEMEVGCTLQTLIERVGGGASTGRPLKAVVLGGPSGSVVAPRSFDEPLVPRGPVNPGTGGVVALDDTASVREAVKTLLGFNARESCGKCTPCREGTARLLAMLDAPLNRERAAALSETIQLASLCGLGQAAPFAVLSGLAEFPGEFGVS